MEIKKFIFQPLIDVNDLQNEIKEAIVFDENIDRKLASLGENTLPPLNVKKADVALEEPKKEVAMPTLFDEETLNAKVKAAFDEGYNKGLNEGITKTKNEQDKTQQEAIDQQKIILSGILDKIERLSIDGHEIINSLLIEDMVGLTKLIASKIGNEILESTYEEKIKSVVSYVLSNLVEKDRLEIFVNEKNIELIKSLIKKENGKLQVEILANNEINIYDCEIKWSQGFLKFNLKDRLDEIEKVINQHLSSGSKSE
ncbi:MAG: hypothetical protein J0H68_02090 [Sphingobacteriia bacterium]|nr:hypothetical protein [Sphingobacteriia bacterium]